MEKFKNITDFDRNIAIISQMNDEDYKSLILLLENLKNFEIVNHNTYIINENPLPITLPDERIIDEYHKDTNTALSINIEISIPHIGLVEH